MARRSRSQGPDEGSAAPVPDAEDVLLTYADTLAAAAAAESEAAAETPVAWVSFHLAERTYALPVDEVREVLRVAHVTRVPRAPAGVRGVTNMRGRVLPVIDLRVRLGMPAVAVGEASRILVVRGASGAIGLLVDRVEQIVPVLPSTVQPAPEEASVYTEAAVGVVPATPRLLILLHLSRLLAPLAADAR